MIPADLIKRLTPEQLHEARRLYLRDGEVFFEQKSDGTLEVISAAQVGIAPLDGHVGRQSWEQSSKFNG